MRKIGAILGLLCLLGALSGCGGTVSPVWETVGDSLDAPVASQLPAYTMKVAVPTDAPLVEAFSDEATQVYAQEGGSYQLTVQTLTASSLDSLLRELTGFSRAELTVLQTQDFGLPRYDVAWAASGEEGMESCRAAILDDGQHYYVLTASAPQEKSAECREKLDQIFSTLGLYTDEGF